MHISIHSLKRTLFNGDAKAVNCKTSSGEITILDHHRPLISILVPGILKVTTPDDKDEYFPICNGLLEVKQNNEARFIVEET